MSDTPPGASETPSYLVPISKHTLWLAGRIMVTGTHAPTPPSLRITYLPRFSELTSPAFSKTSMCLAKACREIATSCRTIKRAVIS